MTFSAARIEHAVIKVAKMLQLNPDVAPIFERLERELEDAIAREQQLTDVQRRAKALLDQKAKASSSGGVRLAPPPHTEPCRHPTTFLPPPGTGDWELLAGRLGDELIRCGEDKAAIEEWVRSVVAVLNRG